MEITMNVTGLDKLADAILALAGAITGVRQQEAAQDRSQQEPLVPPASRVVSEGIPTTPPAGTVTPPAGTVTPPAGTVTPPAGTVTPPAGTVTPPTGIPTTPPTGTVTPPAGQVVTSSTSYSMEDLARAAVQLMDSGKQEILIQLLASFGVSSLPDLPQDQYGAFATALRGMGAQI